MGSMQQPFLPGAQSQPQFSGSMQQPFTSGSPSQQQLAGLTQQDFVPWAPAQSQLGMSTPQSALPGAQSQQQPMPVVPLQGQHQPVGEYPGVPVSEDDSHYMSDGRNGLVS